MESSQFAGFLFLNKFRVYPETEVKKEQAADRRFSAFHLDYGAQ